MIPGGAGALRLRVTAVRGQPTILAITATRYDEAVTAGEVATPASGGHVVARVRQVPRSIGQTRVCIRNYGNAPINLDGGKRRVAGTERFVRLEWLRADRESWIRLLPIIAKRFAWGKANPFGTLLLPMVVFLLGGLWVAGAVVAWRSLDL